jgi:hypothetical protein
MRFEFAKVFAKELHPATASRYTIHAYHEKMHPLLYQFLHAITVTTFIRIVRCEGSFEFHDKLGGIGYRGVLGE